MKNNKGFTLIELLSVIVVLGIILTLAAPTILNNIGDAKKKLAQYDMDGLVDAGKSYIADMDLGNISYKLTEVDAMKLSNKSSDEFYYFNEDNTVKVKLDQNVIVKVGDKLTPYQLRIFSYALSLKGEGIDIGIKDIVKARYFDDKCEYKDEDKNKPEKKDDNIKGEHCKFYPKCTVIGKILIEKKKVNSMTYYVTSGYDSEIKNEDVCVNGEQKDEG